MLITKIKLTTSVNAANWRQKNKQNLVLQTLKKKSKMFK